VVITHVIATGTPGGVGHAQHLGDGHTVVTEIDGIGKLANTRRVIRSAQVATTDQQLPQRLDLQKDMH